MVGRGVVRFCNLMVRCGGGFGVVRRFVESFICLVKIFLFRRYFICVFRGSNGCGRF